MKKVLMIAAVLAVLALALTACGGGQTGIVGKWAYSVSEEGVTGTVTMEFKEDGTLVATIDAAGYTDTQTTTYRIEGDKIITADDNEMTYKIDGNTLTLTSDSTSLVFTRK